MENPKVSVMIPVYNGEKTLKQCIASVLNQSYKNYEVIVVDNNSTDETEEIIKKFHKLNPKVKYIFEEKIGRSAARNAGIKSSVGKIVVMTDSDCVVSKNWIEKIIRPIVYENETAVMGFEEDLVKNYWTKNTQKADWRFIKRNVSGKYVNTVDTKNFAIKSSVLKQLMFDPKIINCDDFDFYLRLKQIAKVRFLPNVRVGHYHKNSFLGTVKINFERAIWIVRIYKKFRNKIDLQKEYVTESIFLKKGTTFLFWKLIQFLRMPIGEAFFALVSAISWRAGLIAGWLSKY